MYARNHGIYLSETITCCVTMINLRPCPVNLKDNSYSCYYVRWRRLTRALVGHTWLKSAQILNYKQKCITATKCAAQVNEHRGKCTSDRTFATLTTPAPWRLMATSPQVHTDINETTKLEVRGLSDVDESQTDRWSVVLSTIRAKDP
jgi:hypothetical protein